MYASLARINRLIFLLLAVELFIAHFVLAQACILRRKHVRAFAAWRDSPTPTTQAELDRQKQITTFYNLGFSLVIFGVMAGATLLAVRIFGPRHSPHRGVPLNEAA